MPYLWGKEFARSKLILNLEETFEHVRNTYRLAEGDFPNIEEFRAVLQRMDFYSFPLTDRRTLNVLQDILILDIPRIISLVSGITDHNESIEMEERAKLAEDDFADLDARAEAILKRSQVNLFSIEDSARGYGRQSGLSWWVLMLALVGGFAAVAVGSHFENHKTLLSLWSMLQHPPPSKNSSFVPKARL